MQVQPEHRGEGGTREVWENRDNGGNVAMWRVCMESHMDT